MSTVTVSPGDLVVKDPQETLIYQFDWGTDNLGAGVTISVSNWAATAVKPKTATALTLDNPANDGSITQTRVAGGQAGAKYRLTNTITTNESPAQIKERSIDILIENE